MMEAKIEKQLLSDVRDIKECLLGKPEYEKTGLVHEFHELKKEVDEIKKKGVRFRWFRDGAIAGGTATATWFGKGWLVKLLPFLPH